MSAGGFLKTRCGPLILFFGGWDVSLTSVQWNALPFFNERNLRLELEASDRGSPQKRLKKVRKWVDKEEKWCIIMILRLEVEVAVLEKRLKKVRISFDKDEFDAKVKPRAS